MISDLNTSSLKPVPSSLQVKGSIACAYHLTTGISRMTNPRVLKEGGFKHLDRVIELCAKEKIYTILDIHTVPGGQNPDWHSDSITNYAAFWDYKDH